MKTKSKVKALPGMKLNILETKFKLDKMPKEHHLVLDPTYDMHAIEDFESRFDTQGIKYCLVECRRQTKKQDRFLGYSLITQDSVRQDSEVELVEIKDTTAHLFDKKSKK